MNAPDEGEAPDVEPYRESSRRPGHELGAARECAGISLDEMASRLNLRLASVEAIERDDYQHLPTAAFVRGYLRAYAREVGMDGDIVVAEFDALCGADAEPELVLREGVPDPAVGRGPTIAVLILVAVALVGAGAWWFQQERGVGSVIDPFVAGEDAVGDETDRAAAAVSAEEESGTGAAAGDAATEVTTDSTRTDAPTEESADDQSGEGAENADTGEIAEAEAPATSEDVIGPASGQEDIDAPPADDTDTAVDEIEAGDEVAAADNGPEDSPLATSSADLAATTAAATGPDRLEIVVDGESWLEIHDSRDRRLVYTLYSGTSPIVLNGWAPFDVFLGNAPAVTIRFGDNVIDPSAFVRSDNTARFLADSDGARRP